MKPELVIQDMSGTHNADVAKTHSRLVRAASWKRQRTIVIIPASETIPARVYLSHCNLIFPPNNGVVRMLALGQEVGEAYSNAIASILEHPELGSWEYVLTLEHDNIPPPDGMLKLAEQMDRHRQFDAIGGLYFTKGSGGVAQIWGDPNDPVMNFRPQPPRAGELQECNGTGMGFTLFRLSMFKDKRLRRPWFKTQAGREGVGTQDLYFWGDAKKHGFRCAIDCSVRVGHYDLTGAFGQPDFVW